MKIDLNTQEIQLLLRQFEKGNVVLFAGAGFSCGAKNRRDNDPPISSELCRLLASECGWEYGGEELQVVYEYAQKRLGTQELIRLFSLWYRDCQPAEWHYMVPKIHWYRIYTTNIDDVIANSYRSGGAQKLERIVCPCPYVEHDQWFDKVLCIHLHGSILDFSKGFTFSFDDMAVQTAIPNPWYQALADDMQARSVIFVGSKLNDSPFYHYLNLRSQRSRGTPEYRARAFLVTPSITPIRKAQLEDRGTSVIEASAEEFFNSIWPAVEEKVPTRLQLLKNRYPHQITALTTGIFDTQSEMLRQFELVSPSAGSVGTTRIPAVFYEGAEPTFEDIRSDVDAEREVTAELLSAARGVASGLSAIIVTGHAGSGKSTVLRRMAYELAREGHAAYFCRSTSRIETSPVVEFAAYLDKRHAYLFVDDAHWQFGAIEEIVRSLPAGTCLTFVLADRPHVTYPNLGQLSALRPQLFEMPYLNRPDCERIIKKLEAFGLLGALQGKTMNERIRIFLQRSKKQLLVAMKEATSGRGFDMILADEYQSLSGKEAKLAYTIACAAYMHGVPVRKRHLLACIDGTDVQKAGVLASDLWEVVVKWRDSDEYLCPRHRVIAHQVATEAAPFEIRKVAVVSYLTQISGDITPFSISRRCCEYMAYRAMINLDNLLDLFGEDRETIKDIYEELKGLYSQDFLFWLQYGRAEVYFDNFSLAENYLNQSLGIRPDGNYQATHYLGVMFLKRSLFQRDAAIASSDARQGEEILRGLIPIRGEIDAYPYAALVKHKLRYVRKWNPPKVPEQLEDLYRLAQAGTRKHPHDLAMLDAYQDVFREYLMIAVKEPAQPYAPSPPRSSGK